MAKQLKTRRDALRQIVGTMAAAAALTSAQIEELLAQVRKVPDLAKLAGIRTADNSVKALKVLLAPSGQGARVFESEFGRKPALKPVKDARSGRLSCSAYLGVGAPCADLACGLVACNAVTLPDDRLPTLQAQEYGRVPGNSSEAGVFNKAQGCVESCTSKVIVVPPTAGVKINPAWLQGVQKDPYIQGLLKELGAADIKDLEAELNQRLADRRAGR